MQQRGGYALLIDPAAPHVVERDTFSCSHCNRVVMLHDTNGKRLESVAVHCHGCDARVCVPCAEHAKCDPLEEKLKRSEARGAFFRSVGV